MSTPPSTTPRSRPTWRLWTSSRVRRSHHPLAWILKSLGFLAGTVFQEAWGRIARLEHHTPAALPARMNHVWRKRLKQRYFVGGLSLFFENSPGTTLGGFSRCPGTSTTVLSAQQSQIKQTGKRHTEVLTAVPLHLQSTVNMGFLGSLSL